MRMKILPVTINPYTIQSLKPFESVPPPQKQLAGGVDSVSFGARISDRFPKRFLREILMCGLPCPICGKKMIPLELLNEPAVDALKLLSPHKKDMSDVNRIIYNRMAEAAEQHPRKNMQELLQMWHAKAEKALIREQENVLEELFQLSSQMPQSQGKVLRKLIYDTKDIMLQRQTPKQSKRFKRKSAIKEFDDFALTLKDDKSRVALMSTIRKLPTSDNSPNAFIVKYSTRSPEEIGMKLFKDDFATMEHVIPDSEGGKIVIWECSADNNARGNAPLIKLLKEKPEMLENFQNHFDRLIEIFNSDNLSPYLMSQKSLLKEYIFTARNEVAIASRGAIMPDISALDEFPPYMIVKEIERIRKLGFTNHLRNLYQMLQFK